MTRVLLAWELGRNLGHAARLSAVAEQLIRAEAEPVWALPHTDKRVLPAAGDSIVVRAPGLRPHTAHKRSAIHSFADILLTFGFGDACVLQKAVSSWLTLFDELRIDRVVLDYAPAAQLAALLAGLPAAQITNGFDAPPPDCPTFGLGMRGPMLQSRNARQVGLLDGSIAAVAKALGNRRELSLGTCLAYPRRWYDCIPETDPYGPRTDGLYVGPLGRPSDAMTVSWPHESPAAPRVLVYLRSERELSAVLEALAALSCTVVCAVPNIDADSAERLRRPSARVYNRPVDLRALLPQCDLVVSYGSSTLVCQALLAGKVQVMLPSDVEKSLVSHRVALAQAGCVVDRFASAEAILEASAQLLRTPDSTRAARTIAQRHCGLPDRLAFGLAEFGRDRSGREAPIDPLSPAQETCAPFA